MSEPPQTAQEEYMDDAIPSNEGEKTQPTEEILNALAELNTQSSGLTDSSQEAVPPPDTPPSEWDSLRSQLEKKPTDVDLWHKLIDHAESSGDYDLTIKTYEAVLQNYPNNPSVQIAYIDFVLQDTAQPKRQYAAGLFNKFLKTSPFPEVWKHYLKFIRATYTGTSAPMRDVVRKAYEFALNHIGHDKDCADVWTDYIQFLKAGECATQWDESQKMDAIRKAYQRAVQIPMDNVKRLWEEYQEFENNLNKITAKKFLSDLQTAHMQARTVLHQLSEHLTVLFAPPPASKSRSNIWLPRPPTFSAGDKALVGRWRMYLKWEEGNPLEIEEKDHNALQLRVLSVYRKALVRMRFFPEIWYMSHVWTMSLSTDQSVPENKRKEKKDEALNILKQGIVANPASFVLNFALAEALEDAKDFPEVHQTFKKFLGILRQGLDETEQAINVANSSFTSNGTASTLPTSSADTSSMIGTQAGIQSQNSSFSTQSSSDEKPSKSKELADRRTEYGIAWIIYMRFARRAETLQSARNVFGQARKDTWTPWEVYEAAALLEYHCNKEANVAMRIFEKGIEYFKDEVEFALRYLGFLISINDDTNARALFERIITLFTPERARPIWERWARYEYQFGNLQAAQNLEKRIAEVYPSDPPIKRFAERHKYLGTDAIAVRDLGFVINRSGNGSGNSRSNGLTRTDTQQSVITNPPSGGSQQPAPLSSQPSVKRPLSPDRRRRDESRGGNDYVPPPPKRQRPTSPSRDRPERERWNEGSSRRRHGSPPAFDRERDRDGPPRRFEKEREEGPSLPPVLSWFVGVLPQPAAFDGPVFRTDDLLQVFKNALIPSSTGIRARSPPPSTWPRSRGRG